MAQYTVGDEAHLNDALANAKSGDTILLKSGSYPQIKLANRHFTSRVTIASADPQRPAEVGDVNISDVGNITLRSLEVGRSLQTGENPDSARMVLLNHTDNVTLDRMSIHGSLDNNPKNDGKGIVANGGNGLKIINSVFRQLARGAVIGGISGVDLSNNVFKEIRSDGAQFSTVSKVVIDNNLFTNFAKNAGDHSDAIQFFTAGQRQSSSDITITNNQILQGTGSSMQGIFLNDETGRLPYRNVLIQNNLVHESSMPNGIAVIGGESVTITGNSALSPPGDASVWIRAQRVRDGTMRNNVADVPYGAELTDVAGNRYLKDDATLSRALPGLGQGGNPAVENLIHDGVGYQADSSLSPGPIALPTLASSLSSSVKVTDPFAASDFGLTTSAASFYQSLRAFFQGLDLYHS